MTRTSELQQLIGQEVGVSRWFEVSQARIDAFADLVQNCRQMLEKKDGPYSNAMLKSVEERSDGKGEVDNER